MTAAGRAFSSRSLHCYQHDAVQPLRRGRRQEPACEESHSMPCNTPCTRTMSRQRSKSPRSSGTKQATFVHTITTSLLLCLLLLCTGAQAHQTLRQDEISGHLHPDDPRDPVSPPRMHLDVRDEATTTIRPTGSATASGPVQVATETTTPLPRPFDSNLGNNFTTSTCPTFFASFLNDQAFAACLPLSLLLQTSNGLFTASRSLVRLSSILDSTCNVNFPTCSLLMASLADQVKQDVNCGADLALGNPTVLQAYNGFLAYDTLYHAGCLTDASGQYCYANAVTNASAPTSSYIYYLPLGVLLPGGSRPACTSCLQNTMAIFAQTATNRTQPLNGDYSAAAALIQMNCGPNFVRASVQNSSASVRSTCQPLGLLITILALLMTFVA